MGSSRDVLRVGMIEDSSATPSPTAAEASTKGIRGVMVNGLGRLRPSGPEQAEAELEAGLDRQRGA